MTDSPEKRESVAIRVEGGRNIRIDNNLSVGMPLLDATDVENLSATGNRTIGHREHAPAPAASPAKAWHEKPWIKAVISVVLTVVAAGIIYALGWN